MSRQNDTISKLEYEIGKGKEERESWFIKTEEVIEGEKKRTQIISRNFEMEREDMRRNVERLEDVKVKLLKAVEGEKVRVGFGVCCDRRRGFINIRGIGGGRMLFLGVG